VKKDYWLKKWQLNDIAFHESHINPDLINYLPSLNLNAGDGVLVPLCGKTKDMLWLAEQGLNVVGVELSNIACNDFFAELNVIPNITEQENFTKYEYNNITLFCGDLFSLSSHDFPTIQAVYDCKALIALSSDMRKKYLHHLVSCLGTQIKFLLLTIETTCIITPPPYLVDSNEVNLLYGFYFNSVARVKCETVFDIPENFRKKGYTDMTESVYIIS
jgi:thiopurine S-methyltransferase